MSIDKKKVMAALIGCVLCMAVISLIGIGFCIGKKVYDRPMDTDIQRDTVTLWDTIPHWYPVPVEVKQQKPQYKWLTKVEHTTDTLLMRDSVLVEVPIESKHYHANEYDAWVSGYDPSLDSIKVYKKTEYITERVTLSKPPNRFTIGLQGGYGYGFKSKQLEPYVGIGIGIRIF